jgi:hypothetical protein
MPPPGESGYQPRVVVVIGDEPYDATLTWNSSITGYDILVPGLGTGTSIVVDADTVLVSFAFDTGKVPIKGTPMSARFTTDISKLEYPVYAIVGMRFPCDDFMAAAIYKAENEGNLILDLQYKKKGVYFQQSGYPIEFSLIPGTQDGSGLLIYAPELLRTEDFIYILPNPEVTMDRDVWTGGSDDLIDFKGGFRGAACTGQLLVEGWEQFKEFKKYPADVYFDTTADPLVAPEMSVLRAEIPYRRFLYPQPMGIRPSEITAPPNVQNRGICTFWGAAYIVNMYEPTGNLLSTLMGRSRLGMPMPGYSATASIPLGIKR